MRGMKRLTIGARGSEARRCRAGGSSKRVRTSTIFVCLVSSDVQEGLTLRPIIEAKPSNGLRLRSQIMTDKMIPLRHDRIRRTIGRIDRETSERLDRALLVVLGLAQ